MCMNSIVAGLSIKREKIDKNGFHGYITKQVF
jgi:hypothetical protein